MAKKVVCDICGKTIDKEGMWERYSLWMKDPNGENWLERIHAIAMSGKSIAHLSVPSYVRRITVSEAAALQGFAVAHPC